MLIYVRLNTNYGADMETLIKAIVTGLMAMLLVAVICAVVGIVMAIPIYYLWNWLMPTIFGISEITYWQAWGLYWLSALLLKSSSSSSSKSSKD